MPRKLGFPLFRIALAAAAFMATLAPAPSAGEDERDPKAVEIAERTMEAMGGRGAFDSLRLFKFRFVVERDGKDLVSRTHVWDRWDGSYRLDTTTRTGQALRVIMNVESRNGEVWLDGEKVEADSVGPYLDRAYGALINDSYWLLMPWKWLDPGVLLTYDGEKTVDGKVYDVVHLQFGSGTGLTSADQYWGYVSRDTGLMERWDYLLQDEEGNPGTGARSTYLWEHWDPVGNTGVRLARDKVRVGGDGPPVAILFPMVEASTEPDSAAFAPGP